MHTPTAPDYDESVRGIRVHAGAHGGGKGKNREIDRQKNEEIHEPTTICAQDLHARTKGWSQESVKTLVGLKEIEK